MLIEPAVTVRRRDALVLAPRQEGVDEWVRVPVGLEEPGPGTGHVDPDGREQVADLGWIAKVGPLAPGSVAQDHAVAQRADPRRVRIVLGSWSSRGPDEVLGRVTVNGQAVALELQAEDRRGRL